MVAGEHDGYTRLPDPVRHRRTLVSVGGEYWLCVDVLEGTGTHTARAGGTIQSMSPARTRITPEAA